MSVVHNWWGEKLVSEVHNFGGIAGVRSALYIGREADARFSYQGGIRGICRKGLKVFKIPH